MIRLVTLVLLLGLTSTSQAAFVAILNATDAEVKAELTVAGRPVQQLVWQAGECKGLEVARTSSLKWTNLQLNNSFQLDPYTPYVLISPQPDIWQFSGVELQSALPKPSDVPEKLTGDLLKPVDVVLYGDAASKLTVEGWTKNFSATLAGASDILSRQVGVAFNVKVAKEWASEAELTDIDAALDQFTKQAKPDAGQIAVGFVSRAVPGKDIMPKLLAGTRHILVRESSPRTEEQRIEVLAHQLSTAYGAVVAPDRGSLMRATVGSDTTKLLQLDPLNVLIVRIWAEELHAGRGPKFAEMNPKARDRLRVLYDTLADLHETLKTNETTPRNYADKLRVFASAPDDKTTNPPVVPKRQPVVVEPGMKQDGEVEAIASVVQAITARAKRFQDDKANPTRDELTSAYLIAAAVAAEKLDKPLRQRAFLIGIGLGLDDSTVLRDKPFLKDLVLKVEPDAQRRERLKVLGSPSIQGRRDWCQHFAVSAALTELLGSAAAEFAGLAKELADMKGASGFSFADLAADYAGIAFAAWVRKDVANLAEVAEIFKLEEFLPKLADYPENINEAQFKKTYGNATDSRFTFQIQLLESDIRQLTPHIQK